MKRFPGAKAFSMMTRSEVLNHLSNMTMDSYVNVSTGECRFNTPDFVGMLEFINTFPETIDWDSYYSNLPDALLGAGTVAIQGQQDLLRMEYVSNFSSIKELNTHSEKSLTSASPARKVWALRYACFRDRNIFKDKVHAGVLGVLEGVISEEAQNELNYSFP